MPSWVNEVSPYVLVAILALLLGGFAAWWHWGRKAEQGRIRRNRLVWQIFQWLTISLVVTVLLLLLAALGFTWLENTGTNAPSEFIQGLVLTALAGAISSILTFIGIIVKGLLDQMDSDPGDTPREDTPRET